MSSASRIRAGEVYTKKEVLSSPGFGPTYLEVLIDDYGLLRCGSDNAVLFVGENIIQAILNHAIGKKVKPNGRKVSPKVRNDRPRAKKNGVRKNKG